MATPLYYSDIPVEMSFAEDKDIYGVTGARLMGIEPMPVQREIWNLLECQDAEARHLYENNAIEVPRRAGKTEGILAEAVGRCMAKPAYNVTYCAQNGVKSRDRFYGLMRRLRGKYAIKTRESRGEERFEFPTNSVLRFMPPKASSFRGDAEDWIIFDEAQEVDEEDAADLIGSVLPLFDTRESGQLTIAGTAGANRNGLLWDALEKGRDGRWGILEYAADLNKIDPNNPDDWLKVHPGPAGVPRERAKQILIKRREEMSEEMFFREYLGIWPLASNAHAFDMELWSQSGREATPGQPQRFGIGFDVTPSGSESAVVAYWRDSAGFGWMEVMRVEKGTKWVPDYVGALGLKYRLPIGYDTAGIDTLAVADEIARKYQKRVVLKGLTTIEFATSCAALSVEFQSGNLRHIRQPALTSAVENASRRNIRDAGWAWGRKQSTQSIATLVAGTVAKKMFDDLPKERNVRVITARSA